MDVDEQVEQLANRLRYEVTDVAQGVGRYVWAPTDAQWGVDPEVVGYLVNHWRTASTTLAALADQVQATAAELADAQQRLADAHAELAELRAVPVVVLDAEVVDGG